MHTTDVHREIREKLSIGIGTLGVLVQHLAIAQNQVENGQDGAYDSLDSAVANAERLVEILRGAQDAWSRAAPGAAGVPVGNEKIRYMTKREQ